MSEIKLDYDKITFQDVTLIFEHRAWLLKHLGLDHVEVFKTRKGYHIRAHLNKTIEDRDILLIQILMGSDIHREIYNFIRIYDGQLIRDWNKLYTKKYLILGTRIAEELGGERELKGYTRQLAKTIEECVDLGGFI
jgi:hypothetical protein